MNIIQFLKYKIYYATYNNNSAKSPFISKFTF